jgi:hypothetical protein
MVLKKIKIKKKRNKERGKKEEGRNEKKEGNAGGVHSLGFAHVDVL